MVGCVATLNQFIFRLGEKGMPLYKLLKKGNKISWTTEAQEVVDRIKAFLTSPPVMVTSKLGEALLLYITTTTQVVITTFVIERANEGNLLKVQRPIYFINEALTESKARYLKSKKCSM